LAGAIAELHNSLNFFNTSNDQERKSDLLDILWAVIEHFDFKTTWYEKSQY
jgi:hypothetical protein